MLDRLVQQKSRDWIGLDWIGLDWIGLDWIGLDWIGLDWIGFPNNSRIVLANCCDGGLSGIVLKRKIIGH